MANRKLTYQVEANVQGYVQGMNEAAYSTDKTEKAIQDMIKESPPLKKALRDANKEAQNLAAAFAMLSKEEKNSAPGKQLAQDLQLAMEKAAELQDVMSDTQTAIRNLASDTQTLDALTDGFSAMGSTLASTLGVIGAVTGKQEDFNRAIAAYAAVESAASAATKVKNMLQKQSSVMLAISRVQTVALNRAQELQVATTKKATIAQRAFNLVAKANPYVLLATAVIAVGAALAAFVIHSKKAEKAQKEQTEATKKQEEAAKELHDTFVNTGTNLLSTYGKLKAEWKALSTEQEKQKWIKDCKDKFIELGLEVNNAKDAEAVFVGNTDAVVKALMKRAQAAAYAAKAQKLWSEYSDLEDEKSKVRTEANAARTNIAFEAKDVKNYKNKKDAQGRDTYQAESEQDFFARRREEINAKEKEDLAAIEKKQTSLASRAEAWAKAEVDVLGVTQKIEKSTTKATKQQITYYDTLSKQVTEYENKLKNLGPNASADEIKKAQNELAKATSKKHEYGIKIGIEKPTKAEAQKIISDLKNKLEDAKMKLNAALLTDDQQIIDEAKKGVEIAQKELQDKEIEFSIALDTEKTEKQLRDFAKKIQDIVGNINMPNVDISKKFNFSALDETGKKAADSLLKRYEKLGEGIANLNKLKGQDNLSKEQLESIEKEKKALEEQQKLVDGALEQKQAENDANQAEIDMKQKQQEASEQQVKGLEALGSMGDMAANALNKVGAAEAAQIAQTAMNMPILIANTVKTIAAMNAEAQAKGAASAFALPFPANLVAWATILGTITSIFASLPSFDSGGIIPGGTSLHDNRLAQVASGEMILNQRQQDNLFNAIDHNQLGGGSSRVEVTGVIHGKDILLVQKNYNTLATKSKQTITIH